MTRGAARRLVWRRFHRVAFWWVVGLVLTIAPTAAAHKGPRSHCNIQRVPGGVEVDYTVFLGHSGFEDGPAMAALGKEVSARTPNGACEQRIGSQSKNASFRNVAVGFRCPSGPITLRSAWVLGGRKRTRMHCRVDREAAWVFSEDKPEIELGTPPSRSSVMAEELRTGFSHVLGGFDHLLFLAVLLVAAASRRKVNSDWGATKELLKIITAFTVGHSVTLIVGGVGWLSVPNRWVEAVIALSIVVVAAENVVRDRPSGRVWLVALFGMVHGLGFAAFQSSLGLPLSGTLLNVFAFNLGV